MSAFWFLPCPNSEKVDIFCGVHATGLNKLTDPCVRQMVTPRGVLAAQRLERREAHMGECSRSSLRRSPHAQCHAGMTLKHMARAGDWEALASAPYGVALG